MVPFYQVVSVYIFFRLPRVVRRWIALPLDQVLELTLTPVVPMIDDGFDFVLFRIFDQVRWWTFKVGTVSSCLFIG